MVTNTMTISMVAYFKLKCQYILNTVFVQSEETTKKVLVLSWKKKRIQKKERVRRCSWHNQELENWPRKRWKETVIKRHVPSKEKTVFVINVSIIHYIFGKYSSCSVNLWNQINCTSMREYILINCEP